MRRSNDSLSVKSINIEKEGGASHNKLFELVWLANFNIYIFPLLKELGKVLPNCFVEKYTSQGVKLSLFLDKLQLIFV